MKKKFMVGLLLLAILTPAAFATLSIDDVEFTKGQTRNFGLVLFTMNNIGATAENGIIEIQYKKSGQLASFFSDHKTCDPEFHYNKHRVYSIPPGGSERIEIATYDIPEGTYDVVINHATQCCTDGVNSYACAAKQPFSFGHYVTTVSYGNPEANADDQCDSSYDALQYVRGAGDLSCSDAVCDNPSSGDSTARCVRRGVCNVGSEQFLPCADGSEALIRICDNTASWSQTGQTCPEGGVIPPPPSVSDDSKALLWVGSALIIVLAVSGFYVLFGRRK